MWIPTFVVFVLLSFFSNLENLLVWTLVPFLEFLPRGPGPFITICLDSCIAVHFDWRGQVFPIAIGVFGLMLTFLCYLGGRRLPDRIGFGRIALFLLGSSMIAIVVVVLGTQIESTYGEGIRGNVSFDAFACAVVYVGSVLAIQRTKVGILSSAVVIYSLMVAVFFLADAFWLPNDAMRGLTETVFGGAEFGDLNFIVPARAFFASLVSYSLLAVLEFLDSRYFDKLSRSHFLTSSPGLLPIQSRNSALAST